MHDGEGTRIVNATSAENDNGNNRKDVGATVRAGGRDVRDARVLDDTARMFEVGTKYNGHLFVSGNAHASDIPSATHLEGFGAIRASRGLGGGNSRARMSVGVG